MHEDDKIDCPECYGSGRQECSYACPGDDPRCISCGGRPAPRCRGCEGDGLIEPPVYCVLCYDDGGELVLAHRHRRLTSADLGYWIERRRITLADCKRGLCEDCAESVGLGKVGP